MKEKFICFSPSKEQFNYIGESLGQGGDRAIYYCKSIGRHRLYRSGYPKPDSKGLALLTFSTADKAQKECDHTNELFNDDFKPIKHEPITKESIS